MRRAGTFLALRPSRGARGQLLGAVWGRLVGFRTAGSRPATALVLDHVTSLRGNRANNHERNRRGVEDVTQHDDLSSFASHLPSLTTEQGCRQLPVADAITAAGSLFPSPESLYAFAVPRLCATKR